MEEKSNKAKSVTILTGFLGAGKTTFLNDLIKHNKESRQIVIENEFGEENIDSDLVFGMSDKIFSFSEGCICCNLNSDLFDLLRKLWESREKFDELVIEATGVADPGFIAMPFVQDPDMEKFYKLDRVICLVDARYVDHQLENTEEARKQIAFSDILLISKGDLVDGSRLEEIKKLLKDINPWATVLVGNNRDGYPIEEIKKLHRDTIDTKIFEEVESVSYEEAKEQEEAHEHEHHHHDHEGHEHHHEEDEHEHHHHDGEHCNHHSHHHEIESFSFIFNKKMDLKKLQDMLLDYLNAHADDLYRVKGFLDADQQPKNRLVVQLAGNLLTINDGEPWKEGENKTSRLVFIGKHLKQEVLQKLLEACVVK